MKIDNKYLEEFIKDPKCEILIFNHNRSNDSRTAFSLEEFLAADISDESFDEITIDFGPKDILWKIAYLCLIIFSRGINED